MRAIYGYTMAVGQYSKQLCKKPIERGKSFIKFGSGGDNIDGLLFSN